MNKNIVIVSTVILTSAWLAGCSSTDVKRLPVQETVDLSGKWNDTDARLVSEQMIKDCLEKPWLSEFNKKTGQNPSVIVGNVENRSHEHIDAAVFVKSLESNLINSGKVVFVASKGERVPVREERKSQNEEGWTDPATIKPIGKETGADFMLQGSINSVKDEAKGQYIILFQINLELVDLTTNQIKWLGQTELKKSVKKTKYSL